ncbi:hypothetical protein IW148_005917 [Coemansia sp. RSA 1199]|nr:hypothetical protein IW148_005917 [Coemansia sp. RSA 1199]
MDKVRRVFDASRAGQKIVANVYRSAKPCSPTQTKQVTLLLAHANGFHKELWEPTLTRMFSHNGDWAIDQAVALDSYNHGDSALTNRTSISTETDSPWFLNARDLLAIVEQLDSPHPVVGIGHSWGASSLLLAEIMSPHTFAGVVATDPVLFRKPTSNAKLREATMKRRAAWPDLRTARSYFEPHAFFSLWDPRVLDLHIKYGLETVPDGKSGDELVLKCRPSNEAAVYAGALHASPFATDHLWKIQCPVAFLTGEKSPMCPPTHVQDITKNMSDCVRFVMPNAGHLLVHEDPDATADHYVRILDAFSPKIRPRSANL